MRILYFGMSGVFSLLPLERLLSDGATIVGVVVPAPSGAPAGPPVRVLPAASRLPAAMLLQPVGQERSISTIARDEQIPVLEIRDPRAPATVAALAALQPDVILVACFPFILPRTVLSLPASGAYNLHPALLPRLRGPAPLFWTFRTGEPPGVTLHRMNARADAGDIVAQSPVTFPSGITYADADRLCAAAGATLMADALSALAHGALTARPQDEQAATYFHSPGPDDFILTADWPARRAFDFIRAMNGYGRPVIQTSDGSYGVREAIELREGDAQSGPLRFGEELWMPFVGGVVRVVG